jgi:hypothetical protein
VQVRGGLGGQLLGRRSFLNNRYKPVGLAGLPDLDGNSVPELALLAVRDSDDQVVVEIRNASGPSSPRQVTLSPGHVPIGLKALPGDTDGNGIPELAVLSSRVADGQESIDIFNAFGEPNLRTVVYDPVQLDVLDFVTVDDGNGDGSVEIAALAERAGDGLYVVDIRELSGQDSPAITRSLRANHRPRAITTVTDANGNGIPELVVLQEDVITGVTRVEVRDELGADNPRLFNYAGGAAVRPLQLIPLPDTDGDSVPEFALLIDHRQTSAANVIVNNASGPGSARTLRFEPGRRSEPISVALLGDADGNGIQDLSLLQDLGGVVGAEMRNLNGPGSPWYIRFD